jgi:hypothetical protein
VARDAAPGRAPDPDPDVDPDDAEALSWAGDDDRGQVGPRRRSRDAAAESDAVADAGAVVEPDDTVLAGDELDAAIGPRSAPASAAARAVTAAFAAVYLALTLGWLLSVQSTTAGTADLLTQVLWQLGEFFAIAAAPLWFFAVTSLTARAVVRTGWFALGAGVLLPWPLLVVVLS